MKVSDSSQIPPHTNCCNCGSCCGIIPVSRKELKDIHMYLQSHPSVLQYAAAQTGQVTCPFRDNAKKRCLIYEIRPIICRLFGVTEGMNCPNGNTCEVDARDYINSGVSVDPAFEILNLQKWDA